MPRSVIFLISDHVAATASNDNYVRLPKAFSQCGWQVCIGDPDRLMMSAGALSVDGHRLDQADLIWPLGFGPKAGFMDRAHLLNQLPQRRLITPMAELLLSHGKAQWAELCAPTHISNNPGELQQIAHQYGGDWVLKPLAGSYGRGVQHVPVNHYPDIEQAMSAQPGVYFVLQRFVPEILVGEIRTLVAGGEIIGSYRRSPQKDIRANLAKGGRPMAVAEKSINKQLLNRLVAELSQRQIGYAAIDTVGDYLMEVNLANPGGLATLTALYERDFETQVVRAICAQKDL